ncbi:MAG: crotonase/enoyl-CoA hydratase family protein [Sandaracinaceae bacterium]|nr:crotonase/enoyl-CoA hydratase family protein [Sandaracinaceae bacterium]
MSYRSLTVENQDGIAKVTLVGPGKGNAMGPDFWREMPLAFRALSEDESVRVIVLRGSGDHFSYGLDLMAMMTELGPLLSGAPLASGRTKLLRLIERMQEAANSVDECTKPVVAAIHGWCIGGGLDLISACDVRIASEDAKFSLREVKIAMVADMGSLQRLPHIIGEGHTRELALTGKNIDAKRAREIGLVNDVVASPEALWTAADALAKDIAANPPLVVQGIKEVMREGQNKSTREALHLVAVWNSAFLQSNDLGEAINAYAQKRPGNFKGE